jgi:hypothetical protein
MNFAGVPPSSNLQVNKGKGGIEGMINPVLAQ